MSGKRAGEKSESKRRKLRRIRDEENEPSQESSSQLSSNVIDADAEEAELEMERGERKEEKKEIYTDRPAYLILDEYNDMEIPPNSQGIPPNTDVKTNPEEDKLEKDKKIFNILLESQQWKDRLTALKSSSYHLLQHSKTIFGAGFGPSIDVKIEIKGCEVCRVDSPLICYICKDPHNFQIALNRETGKVKVTCSQDESEGWGQNNEVTDFLIHSVAFDSNFDGKKDFISKAIKYARGDFDEKKWEDFNPRDPYDFSDYLKEISQFLGRNLEHCLQFAATRINRVVAFLPPEEFAVKRNSEDEKFFLTKKLPSAKMKHIVFKKGKEKIETIPHSDIINGLLHLGVLRVYNRKAVIPLPHPPRKTLNMWIGFEIDYINPTDYPPIPGALDELKDYVENGLCGGEFNVYRAFMRFFQYLIKFPQFKVPWCIYLYTQEKRMGKSLWMDFLQQIIFGKATMACFSGLREFANPHNGWLVGKKLCWIEEASSAKEEFKHNWDHVKNFISGTMSNVNPKFVNQFNIENYSSLGINTNHKHAILLEPGDRRYFCPNVRLAKPHISKDVYFTRLVPKIKNFNTGLQFVKWLRETEEFDDIDLINSDPPMTTLKRELIENSFLAEHKFLQEIGLYRFCHVLQFTSKLLNEKLDEFSKKYETALLNVNERTKLTEEVDQKIKEYMDANELKGHIIWSLHPTLNTLNKLKRHIPNDYPTDGLRFKDIIPLVRTMDTEIKELIKNLSDDDLAESPKEDTLKASLQRLVEGSDEKIEEKGDGEDEKSRYKVVNTCILTTNQLYDSYCEWFKIRMEAEIPVETKNNDGSAHIISIVKGPKLIDKTHFFKRLSGCINQNTRLRGIRKLRRYDLDSIHDMYLNWTETTRARTLLLRAKKVLD